MKNNKNNYNKLYKLFFITFRSKKQAFRPIFKRKINVRQNKQNEI